MADITRFNPLTPMDEMFDEPTRGFFVRPLAFPSHAELQIKSSKSRKTRRRTRCEKTIYSERSYGRVSRHFDLPTEIDAQACKAEHKDGVLNLVLPKKNGASGRRISVS